MECYTHAGANAIGSCKYCGKGLCRSCVRDTGVGLACGGACERENKLLHALTIHARKGYGIGTDLKRSPPTSIVMPGLIGLMFAGMGVADIFFLAGGFALFAIPMGLLFIFGAWYGWRKYREHGINM